MTPCRHALKVQLCNIMLWSSTLHDCSHTAEMHDVVIKGVTCYKDARPGIVMGTVVPMSKVEGSLI